MHRFSKVHPHRCAAGLQSVFILPDWAPHPLDNNCSSPCPTAPQPLQPPLLSVSARLMTPVTSQKWNHTVFVSSWLVYFTSHTTLKVHPCWVSFLSKPRLMHRLLHGGFPDFPLLRPTPHPTWVATLFSVPIRPLVLIFGSRQNISSISYFYSVLWDLHKIRSPSYNLFLPQKIAPSLLNTEVSGDDKDLVSVGPRVNLKKNKIML